MAASSIFAILLLITFATVSTASTCYCSEAQKIFSEDTQRFETITRAGSTLTVHENFPDGACDISIVFKYENSRYKRSTKLRSGYSNRIQSGSDAVAEKVRMLVLKQNFELFVYGQCFGNYCNSDESPLAKEMLRETAFPIEKCGVFRERESHSYKDKGVLCHLNEAERCDCGSSDAQFRTKDKDWCYRLGSTTGCATNEISPNSTKFPRFLLAHADEKSAYRAVEILGGGQRFAVCRHRERCNVDRRFVRTLFHSICHLLGAEQERHDLEWWHFGAPMIAIALVTSPVVRILFKRVAVRVG